MSDFSKENIEVLKQYFLSDDERIKQEIRASAPALLLNYIHSIQDGFDRKVDAKTIASQLQATAFEKELEQIQSQYYYKLGEKENLEFEHYLASAIKQIEREKIKKKLIAYDASLIDEVSEAELVAAITAVERESLKNNLRQIDHEEKAPVAAASPAAFESGEFRGRDKVDASKMRIPIYLKYVAAACVLLAIGIWQFNVRMYTLPHNDGIVLERNKADSLFNDSSATILAKKAILAEVTRDTSKYRVLTSGLGFGDIAQNITIIEHNQRNRISSLERAIQEREMDTIHADRIHGSEEKSFDTAVVSVLSDSLIKKLAYLNLMEQQYLFNGQQLSLFTSVPFKEKTLVLYDETYYLKLDKTFFKLKVSSKPLPLSIETNPDILKVLDKIIYNAK